MIDIHRSSLNFEKLNCCKVKVTAELSKIPVAINFNGHWLSIVWLQDLQDIHHQVIPDQPPIPKIKSMVFTIEENTKIFPHKGKFRRILRMGIFLNQFTPSFSSTSNSNSNSALRKLNMVWRKVSDHQLRGNHNTVDSSS